MFGRLAAGTYRGQIGNRIYGHDTGGSMQGRYVRHAAMGQALAVHGMHMGGVRLLSGVPVLPSGGRDVRLGALYWSSYAQAPAYMPPATVVRGLGTVGYRAYAPQPPYVDPAPVVPYTPLPSAIRWQRLNLGSARLGIMGRRRFW